MRHHHNAFCSIIPPHILRKLAEDPELRDCAFHTLEVTEQFRGMRQAFSILPLTVPAGAKHRTFYDARNKTSLPGTQVLDEGETSSDVTIKEAYDYSGDTYDFYESVFSRNSVDDHGLTLKSTIHYDKNYDNAFWNGQQMIYGDGDGKYFNRFTICLDVIGHELTHGVTQNEAQLVYDGQSGALNESMSDVFGSPVKHMDQ